MKSCSNVTPLPVMTSNDAPQERPILNLCWYKYKIFIIKHL